MTNQTIFISHSTADDTAINKIAESLEKAGHTVWVDHRNGIIPGTPSWDKEIRMAIKNADVGVFVMTEKSLDSGICGAECLLILELKKPLYVLRLEACQPENIWLYIKQIQYADLTKNFDVGMASFLEALGGATGDHLPLAFSTHITGRETMQEHLPFLSNPLRGRDDDVRAIQALIGGHVTQIVGLGGWGKSRISAEIALAYPDGAVWHRCSVVSRGYDLLNLFRKHLDLPDDTKADDVLARLAQFKPLVVIDNAEDVAPHTEARKGYVDLLNQLIGYGVPMLLTTRILWDEFKPRKQYPPPQLPTSIASQITADFAESQEIPMTTDQAEAIAIAARLHPRLIEFAVLLIPEIGYEATLRRLKALKHDDIQEALDDMIRKTLEQMRQEAKHGENAYALIHNMTWLQGSFSLDAIQAIQSATITDEDDLLDALTILGRYQFVRRDPTTERYSLMDVVRDTVGYPSDPAIFDAYADFYIGRAKAIFVDLRDNPELWRDHEADFPNIIALGDALSTRTQNGTTGDLSRVMHFAENTGAYVTSRMEQKAWGWLEMGLSAVRELRKSSPDDKELQKNQADLTRRLGLVWDNLGEHQKALELFEQAVSLFRAIGHQKGEAWTLNNIGAITSYLGDKHKALDYFEQALVLVRAVGDKVGESRSLGNIGALWSYLGYNDKALAYYEQILPIFRTLGDKPAEAIVLGNMGSVQLELGDNDKALAYYEQALFIFRIVGDRRGEADILMNIGDTYYQLGNLDEAINYLERAIATTFEGDPNLPKWQEKLTQLKAQRDSSA
jgi:tetratricopeptide (TPR) repeat protein